MTFTATNTTVLHNGQPYATAATEQAAQDIADMMNLPAWLEQRTEQAKATRAVKRIYRVLASDLRAKLHGGGEG